MINVVSKHLVTIQRILDEFAPDCEVRAFGSRVNGTSHAGSDLDLVIVRRELLDVKLMAKLRNAFTESNLPFHVDTLEWNAIPENFRQCIGKKYEVVKEASTELM